MDLSMPLKDCTVTLCDLKMNKNIHQPENFAELETKSINKENDILEFDDLEINRKTVLCRGSKRRAVSNFESKKSYKEISSDSESESEKIYKKISSDSESENEKNYKETSSDSESENDKNYKETSSDSEEPKRKVVNDFKSKKNGNDSESDSERELSSYEQMIKKRCQENRAFLQSIKIDEAKTDFFEAMGHVKRKKPVRKQQTETEKIASRKSKRLENCHFEFSEKKMLDNATEAAAKGSKILPSPMSFKAAVNTLHKNYLKDIGIQEPKADDEFCLYDKYVLENMKHKISGNTTFSNLKALCWYPSSDHLILAAGNNSGHVVIWNVSSKSFPVLMRIHKSVYYISHQQFSPYNQTNLICSSLDGTIFCADLIQQTFSKICGLNKACTYFDFYSASIYLVALKSGHVAIVDKRTDAKNSRMTLHACSDFAFQTINNHPVNRNYFITAHDKEFKLWDLRKLRRYPIADNYQDESLRSAFFSPNTGNNILATYRQPCLRMFSFNNTDLEDCIKLEKTLSLNKDANLSAATWLSEELFSARQGVKITGINIYSKDMQDYAYLPTSTKFFGLYSFHPKTPALAYSRTMGRISVDLKE